MLQRQLSIYQYKIAYWWNDDEDGGEILIGDGNYEHIQDSLEKGHRNGEISTFDWETNKEYYGQWKEMQ
jgi:hypothetical protein